MGPKAQQMKLWDLPLAHISPGLGQYSVRRSGWLHLSNGYSFCMEAVNAKEKTGQDGADPFRRLNSNPPQIQSVDKEGE